MDAGDRPASLEQAGKPIDSAAFTVDPSDEGWSKKAADIFRREGFVVLHAALSDEACSSGQL